jgi:hypothetical protein
MNNLMLFSMAELSSSMVNALNANLGIWYLIILNAFGVLAIILKVIEYQISKRSLMMVIATLANAAWVLFFILNGNFTAGITCILIVVRMLIYVQRGKKKWADSNLWVVLFVVLQAVASILTFKNWQDIFSTVAGFVGIFAYLTTNQTRYRFLSFIYMALWLSNSICYFIATPMEYIVALGSDSFSTASVMVGIYRYDLSKKAREDKALASKQINNGDNN